MSYDNIATTGLAALFGGALVWAVIGALVGRFQGFEVGVSTGMILFGLTGLSFAGWLAWLLWGPGAEVPPGRNEIGMVGGFGAFGGFGALGGGAVLARELDKRRPRAPTPVSTARGRLAILCTAAGHVVLLSGVVRGLVMADHATSGTLIMFRSVAVACGCWSAASVLGGGLKVFQVLFFVLLGGGFYLASQSLRLFGSSD